MNSNQTVIPNMDQAVEGSGALAAVPERMSMRRYLATSDRPVPSLIRRLYKAVPAFSVPAPAIIARPLLWVFIAARSCWHTLLRVFVCEPIFKAYFTRYGRRFRADCHIPWIDGRGDIFVGDNVIIGGKLSITFGARYSDHPTLRIGDNTEFGHDCMLAIGKQITIGCNCLLSGGIWIADSNGHPSNVADRVARKPPANDDVRPVVIGDGVWIGRHCLIFPGVKIGAGSIVSAGSIVRGHIPPYSVVAGNPAKVVFRMKPPPIRENPLPPLPAQL
jgi:acetyltransferase-like isoleucine patch superfamily enzyme